MLQIILECLFWITFCLLGGKKKKNDGEKKSIDNNSVYM